MTPPKLFMRKRIRWRMAEAQTLQAVTNTLNDSAIESDASMGNLRAGRSCSDVAENQ